MDLLETAVMYIILNQDLVHTKFFGGRYTLDKDEIVDWLNEEVPESGKVWISKRRELRYEFTGAYEYEGWLKVFDTKHDTISYYR